MTSKAVKSACSHCYVRCGTLVHLEDGKVIKIEGDPESPISKGALCVKGIAAIEYLRHPDRLKHPLKRVGARGAGKWAQVSWNEALDAVAGKWDEIRNNYGAESLFMAYGGIKGLQDSWLQRLANTYGTPNVTCTSYICHVPRILSSMVTHGFGPRADLVHPPACVMVWGCNTLESQVNEHRKLVAALDKGAKLIIIDPRSIDLTPRAELWVRPRPGSDLALALGMMNVIIDEALFDRAFVDQWTVGFDRLAAHLQQYRPEKIEEITWVPATRIREAARLYAATKPACIVWGNGLDHNVNSFQTGRAVAILRAITGNLCTPGGDVSWEPPASILPTAHPDLTLTGLLKTRDLKVSAGLGLLDMLPVIPAMPILHAIKSGEPYPIRAGYIQGTNLISSTADAQETLKALSSLEFLVVAELFKTPTAELADFVLPVAGSLECDSIAFQHYPVAQVQQKVAEPVGESWPVYRIIYELAKRLGLKKHFWDTEEEAFDFILKPAGLTFQEFKKVGALAGRRLYKEYEPGGFKTPSKKVELYSEQLRARGLDPMPEYRELPESPFSAPQLAKEYPLIFTDRKAVSYLHSEGRQIESLREMHPEPLISIHPEAAKELGIAERDWVYVETKRGRIKQKVTLATDVDPRVVYLDYGWWYPEKPAEELHGWAESNINILTDSNPPYNREMGSTNLRGILCKVYKVPE
ncbi:MAG: molybdopterin-dependent oxidoreductase [Thermodesulfobacteriota bacterium]